MQWENFLYCLLVNQSESYTETNESSTVSDGGFAEHDQAVKNLSGKAIANIRPH